MSAPNRLRNIQHIKPNPKSGVSNPAPSRFDFGGFSLNCHQVNMHLPMFVFAAQAALAEYYLVTLKADFLVPVISQSSLFTGDGI